MNIFFSIYFIDSFLYVVEKHPIINCTLKENVFRLM